MTDMVNLTIDGVAVAVPKGTLVVDAAKKVNIDIPVFCYHPKLAPVGMCRMCVVKIGTPKIDRATNKPELDADGADLRGGDWSPPTGSARAARTAAACGARSRRGSRRS